MHGKQPRAGCFYRHDDAQLALSVTGQITRYTLDYAAGSRILAESTPTETVSYLYPSASLGTGGHDCAGSGLPVGEQRGDELALSGAEGWLYYLHDAEGYVRQGADAEGDVISAWLFDPDGQGNHVFGGFPCWKAQTARSAISSAAGCTIGPRG